MFDDETAMSAPKHGTRNARKTNRARRHDSRHAVRLEPMGEEEFRASRERGIARHAAEQVRRGLWTEDAATETANSEFTELLPQDRETPGYHFFKIVDLATETSVGETWYNVKAKGGRVQFWIDWIWIDPAFRRRGYATSVLRNLEDEALECGADRVGLHVVADNDAAIALYSSLGFLMANHRMAKLLGPPLTPEA